MASNLEITGIERVRRKVRNIDPDLVPIGPKIGNVIARHVRRQFATKGAHFGTPWKPLAASTRKDKRMHGWPAGPLVRTGDLKMGVTRAPMDIESYTNVAAFFGTGNRKAKWQHYGTKRHGRVHIPARKILKKTPAMDADVKDLIRRQVTRRI